MALVRLQPWVSLMSAMVVSLQLSCIDRAKAADPTEIRPDRSTPTSVSITPDGHATVRIAPADPAGVSVNRYDRFDVGSGGATLDNGSAGARLIVNDVRDTRASRIYGRVAVEGVAAGIIVANPHGIQVNGGRFVGVSGVTLGAGIASRGTSGAVRLEPGKGTLSVGPAGIEADGDIALIGGRIEVSGRVEGRTIDLVAGRGAVSIDPSTGGIAGIAAGRSAGDRLIEVSSGAVLNGGAVRVRVTDAGAGVRIAGAVNAGTGSVQVASTGYIAIGGNIDAAQSIVLVGSSVSIGTDQAIGLQARDRSIRATATAGNVRIRNAVLRGKSRDTSSFDALGAITLQASGDIDISGRPSSRVVLHGESDGVVTASEGNTRLNGVDVQSPAGWTASANGHITARDLRADVASLAASSLMSQSWDGVDIAAGDFVRLSGPAVEMLSSADLRRTRIVVANGGMSIAADAGDIRIEGAAIDVARAIASDPDARGALTLTASGSVSLLSIAPDRLFDVLARNHDVSIRSGADIINDGGSISTPDNLVMTAGGLVRNAVRLAASDGDVQRGSFSRRFGQQRMTSTFGSLLFPDAATRLHAGLGFTLVAREFRNLGAEVDARTIDIAVSGEMENRSLLIGSFAARRTCLVVCFGYRASSSIAIQRASLAADDQLSVRAGGQLLSTGARMTSLTDMSVLAREITFNSLMVPQVVVRRAGLGNLFLGSGGWVGLGWDGGLVGALDGRLHLQSDGTIRFSGIAPISALPLSIAGARLDEARPAGVGPIGANPIGWLSWLPQ